MRIDRLAKPLFVIAVVTFGTWYVVGQWREVRTSVHEASPMWIMLALVLGAIGQWMAAEGFRKALGVVGHNVPRLDAARIYFVSQLAKYVPGSVWPLVAISEMSRRHGVLRAESTTAGLLAMFFSLGTAGLLGTALMLATVAGSLEHLWWVVVLIALSGLAMHPRILKPAIAMFLQVARQSPVGLHLDWPRLSAALGWPLLSWVFLGLQCWALSVGLGARPLESLGPAVGGFALAYAAGVLFVPAPAGIGVREAVLLFALTEVAPPEAAFTTASIIVVVLLSRLLMAILDFAQAALMIFADRRASASSLL